MTPMKAIRAKCLGCCCGQYKEVEFCPCSDCSLHPYRFGKNPNIQMTDEQRAKRAANFKKSPIQQGEKFSDTTTAGNLTHKDQDSEKPLDSPAISTKEARP